MKPYILMIALLLSAPAVAKDLAYITNEAGGKIVINTTSCHNKSQQGMMIVYGTARGGRTITGCWMLNGDNVIVLWDSGGLYTYPVEDFMPVQPMPLNPKQRL
jgi:hypothetical protein